VPDDRCPQTGKTRVHGSAEPPQNATTTPDNTKITSTDRPARASEYLSRPY